MGIESLLSQQIIGLSESIDDRVAALLVAGTGITLTYNDGAGTLTIANTGLGGSTGSTDNRILRADGTGGATVQNSAVTIDDSGNISGLGTMACGAITSSGRLSVTASDSIRINSTSSGNGGLISAGDNGFRIVQIGGTSYNSNGLLAVGDGSYLGIRNTGGLYWVTSTNPVSNSAQTGIISPSAGVVEINNGTAGTRRDLQLRNLSADGLITLGAYTVATLPAAASNTGAIAQVTDSSVTANGSTVAGSGANRVVVFSNGSNWDVVVA